jgi:hypothetical protein
MKRFALAILSARCAHTENKWHGLRVGSEKTYSKRFADSSMY